MVGIGEMLAAAVIKEVVRKLSALLQASVLGPAKRIQSFKKDLEEMEMTLESIEAAIADAEKRSINDRTARLWLKRLKKAAYEISDMFDEFQHGSPPGKLQQGPSWYKVLLGSDMTKKMKNMNKRLKQITEQRNSYGTGCVSSEPNKVTSEESETTSMVSATIVGRRVEKQSLINILLSSNNKACSTNAYPQETSHCTVIYGLAGVGKTELAKLVFKDERIEKAFPQRAWVYLHQNWNDMEIGRAIISVIEGRSCNLEILELIYQHLKKVLQSRCLIVLDNLWDPSHLEKLQDILGSNVSILVTSRRDIRLNMRRATLFPLDPLSDRLSFDLVKQVASSYFLEGHIPEIAIEEIVTMCRGVPLALKCVASLLKPEKNINELLSLIKAIFPPKSDYGTTGIQQTVFASLKLTYHLMKSSLKLCFAYCAIFTKGYEIDREDLCHQWIALGLTEKMYAEDNVRELLVMSFLQDSEPPSEIKKLEKRLATLRSSCTTSDYSAEEKSIERKLCELFECEEIMARQRSRVDWLREGDRNTSFFHARATARRNTNRISYLLKEDGTKCEDKEQIKGMAHDFYMHLFSSEPCTQTDVILEAIPCKVNQDINEELDKPFTNEEIHDALFQMGPTKAPGPDGFPALFYQRHWDFFKAEICSAVRSFLQDMMKAYDRVEWSYLQGVMNRLGFSQKWTTAVMRCVTNVKYAVRVNGELSHPFIPTRGLRQGDPISPYLFLLCAEGLSCLLKKKERDGSLRGVKNGNRGPAISHLLFADDSILFARGDVKNLQVLNELLRVYSEGSGQRINLEKSSVFFGDYCPEQVKHRVKAHLNVHNEALQANYLGMPSWVGKSPTHTLNFLPDRMWKRIRGWTDRPLSRAGKEIMLKSVIQAIPIYVMSCFRLSNVICDKMRKIISNHWWGIENGKKKMHWRSWEWLTTPKSLGGMGFRDMELFNQAMLGKQCWRILTVPDSLCARVLKGRYFPHCDFWNAPKPRRSSFTWRSLMHGKKLLERGVLWRVGDGKTIRISRDRWVQSSSLLKPIASLPDDLTVNFLINEETKSWNEQRVRSCFTPDDATEILNIPLSLTYCEDFPSWPHSKSGIYTVKTAYSLVRLESMHHFLSSNGRGESSDQTEVSKLWKRLWSIQAPPKMKTVLWRMVQNCLPTGAQLRQRHIPASDTCYFCGREETVEHIFLRCQFASGIWREMKKAFGLRCKFNYMAPIKQWFFDFLADASDEETMVFTITVWHIWQTRNAVRNGEKAEHPSSVVQRAKAYVEMILLHLFKLRTSHRCESKCSPPRWIPPPDGWLMLNVDAAIFKDPPRSGVGLVIRDHLGQFRAACCLLVQKIGDPELAEAIAVRCAISFAKENNLQQVIVASDCQNIISKIHSSTKDRSYVGIIVQDIKNLSRGSLFSFTHVSRRGNEAAHVIARLADQFAGSVWYIEPPEIIRNVICNDLSN